MRTKTIIRRLDDLGVLIGKYAHRWYIGRDAEPSDRMYGWVDEYNKLRSELRERNEWNRYCDVRDFARGHDGYDLLA